MHVIGPDGGLLFTQEPYLGAETCRIPVPTVFQRFIPENKLPASGPVLRTDVLRAAGGFDTRVPKCPDWKLWLELGLRYDAAWVAEPLFSLPLARRQRHHRRLGERRLRARHAADAAARLRQPGRPARAGPPRRPRLSAPVRRPRAADARARLHPRRRHDLLVRHGDRRCGAAVARARRCMGGVLRRGRAGRPARAERPRRLRRRAAGHARGGVRDGRRDAPPARARPDPVARAHLRRGGVRPARAADRGLAARGRRSRPHAARLTRPRPGARARHGVARPAWVAGRRRGRGARSPGHHAGRARPARAPAPARPLGAAARRTRRRALG